MNQRVVADLKNQEIDIDWKNQDALDTSTTSSVVPRQTGNEYGVKAYSGTAEEIDFEWARDNWTGEFATKPHHVVAEEKQLSQQQGNSAEFSVPHGSGVLRFLSGGISEGNLRYGQIHGFGLERYDATGAWRTHDGPFEIDDSGTLPEGTTFRGSLELKGILRSQHDAFTKNLTEKLLTYALGRGLEAYDAKAVDTITERVATADHRFSSLVLGVVESQPFRMRRPE